MAERCVDGGKADLYIAFFFHCTHTLVVLRFGMAAVSKQTISSMSTELDKQLLMERAIPLSGLI